MPSTRDQLDPAETALLSFVWEYTDWELQDARAMVKELLARFSLTPVEDEEKTVKPDPMPWTDGTEARSNIRTGSWDVFAPRHEYSQNREDFR